jgi:hypothetical protein
MFTLEQETRIRRIFRNELKWLLANAVFHVILFVLVTIASVVITQIVEKLQITL